MQECADSPSFSHALGAVSLRARWQRGSHAEAPDGRCCAGRYARLCCLFYREKVGKFLFSFCPCCTRHPSRAPLTRHLASEVAGCSQPCRCGAEEQAKSVRHRARPLGACGTSRSQDGHEAHGPPFLRRKDSWTLTLPGGADMQPRTPGSTSGPPGSASRTPGRPE